MVDQPGTSSSASLRVHHNKNKILSLWETRVRALIPAARDQNKVALRDSLPIFLEQVSVALKKVCSDELLEEQIEICKEHGKERAILSDYSLQQIILEYHLLREVIFLVVEETGPIQNWERDIILDNLLLGVQHATDEFVQVQRVTELASLKKTEEAREDLRSTIVELKLERDERDRFISVLGHDLRNPLNAAKMAAQIIQMKIKDSDLCLNLASKICTNIDRVDKMIQDLLDANRMRAGQRPKIDIQHVDLCHVILEVMEDLKTIHGERFMFVKAPESIQGYWDQGALRRVLENLCDNAIKYGFSKAIVQISARVLPNNLQIEIIVHNEGQPLSVSEQSSLFNPYFRSLIAQKSETRGWGIGLFLVKEMVEVHGGNIRVESSEGKGTDFIIVLPLDSRWMQGNPAESVNLS